MLKRLASSETGMRTVFNHFQNLVIASAVVGAAIWVYTNNDPGSMLPWMQECAAVLLGVMGLFLFVANELHGHRQLHAANLPLLWETVIRLVYSASVLYFLYAIAATTL